MNSIDSLVLSMLLTAVYVSAVYNYVVVTMHIYMLLCMCIKCSITSSACCCTAVLVALRLIVRLR
jgi:hypothetical protein